METQVAKTHLLLVNTS